MSSSSSNKPPRKEAFDRFVDADNQKDFLQDTAFAVTFECKEQPINELRRSIISAMLSLGSTRKRDLTLLAKASVPLESYWIDLNFREPTDSSAILRNFHSDKPITYMSPHSLLLELERLEKRFDTWSMESLPRPQGGFSISSVEWRRWMKSVQPLPSQRSGLTSFLGATDLGQGEQRSVNVAPDISDDENTPRVRVRRLSETSINTEPLNSTPMKNRKTRSWHPTHDKSLVEAVGLSFWQAEHTEEGVSYEDVASPTPQNYQQLDTNVRSLMRSNVDVSDHGKVMDFLFMEQEEFRGTGE